jgi:hypothetical protein
MEGVFLNLGGDYRSVNYYRHGDPTIRVAVIREGRVRHQPPPQSLANRNGTTVTPVSEEEFRAQLSEILGVPGYYRYSGEPSALEEV